MSDLTSEQRKQLRLAYDICIASHKGQLDKQGADYRLHPIMAAARLDDPALKCAALLHDVLEDTDRSAADLLEFGVLPEIVETVEAVTHQPDEDYPSYLARVRENPWAVQVKIADLRDNLDETRGPWPGRLARQYRRALAYFGAWEEVQPGLEPGDSLD